MKKVNKVTYVNDVSNCEELIKKHNKKGWSIVTVVHTPYSGTYIYWEKEILRHKLFVKKN